MSVRSYEKEEKQAYVEDYRKSGETLAKYARENGIPQSTLKGWIKEEETLSFGAIEIKQSNTVIPKSTKSATVFVCENIRIELKEGFDKNFLRRIVEVLINDK